MPTVIVPNRKASNFNFRVIDVWVARPESSKGVVFRDAPRPSQNRKTSERATLKLKVDEALGGYFSVSERRCYVAMFDVACKPKQWAKR